MNDKEGQPVERLDVWKEFNQGSDSLHKNLDSIEETLNGIGDHHSFVPISSQLRVKHKAH